MRLKELGFTPMELAICCATHGVGALLAPLGAQLADRYFAAEKCVAVFSLLSSLFLIGLLGADTLETVLNKTFLGWWDSVLASDGTALVNAGADRYRLFVPIYPCVHTTPLTSRHMRRR
jgi:hypothetical protein